MSHEEGFIRSFILAEKQDRYLDLLASPKRRPGFLFRLNHNLDYASEFATLVPASEQTVPSIERILRQRGAPDLCFTISSHKAWDGRELPLHDALKLVVGFNMGTVLSCVPGRLAYYEAEDLGRRYILFR